MTLPNDICRCAGRIAFGIDTGWTCQWRQTCARYLDNGDHPYIVQSDYLCRDQDAYIPDEASIDRQ